MFDLLDSRLDRLVVEIMDGLATMSYILGVEDKVELWKDATYYPKTSSSRLDDTTDWEPESCVVESDDEVFSEFISFSTDGHQEVHGTCRRSDGVSERWANRIPSDYGGSDISYSEVRSKAICSVLKLHCYGRCKNASNS